MTHAQQHTLDRYFDAARSLPVMSDAQARSLLRARIASGRSPWPTIVSWLIVAIIVLLGVLAYRSLRESTPKPTTSIASSAVASAPSTAGAGAQTEDSTQRDDRTARSAGPGSPSRSPRTKVTLGRGVTDASPPRSAAPSIPIAPPMDTVSGMKLIAAAVESMWSGHLQSLRARIDDVAGASDRAALDRMRMRVEWMGLDLDRAASVPVDTPAMRAELMTMYQEVNRLVARYPAIYDSYRDSVVRFFGGYIDTVAAMAAAARAVSAVDSIAIAALRAEAEMARASYATIIGDSARMQMMYQMGVIPTAALYHGEEVPWVLEKFMTTMGIFGMHADPRRLVGLDSVHAHNVIAAATPSSDRRTLLLELVLHAPSRGGELRIVDRSGVVVRTDSAPSRASGMHAMTSDISALAPGEYMTHLTLELPEGRRAYTSTFRVAP